MFSFIFGNRRGLQTLSTRMIFMNSVCFYFAFSDAFSPRSWQEARQFCINQGGDLAVIDSREKHLAITELITNYQDPSRPIVHIGFWIGLRDIEEGIWKWLDGTRLTTGYWNDGEPNDSGGEDCAATYPRGNPFKAWNDAPCNHILKWICQMTPRSAVKMDTENAGTFDGSYNKLIHQEDISGDELTLYSNQEQEQVSMSVVRPESSLKHYKRLTVSLAVLAVILLAVDIGLGVYYGKFTDGQDTIMDISAEVAKLQAAYDTAIWHRDEAKKQLAREIREQQITKWELDHQKSRSKDYLKLKEGCRHCLPGWTFMNSVCFYLAISEDFSPRSWQEARQFCINQGVTGMMESRTTVVVRTVQQHIPEATPLKPGMMLHAIIY
ncbi:hypothetical protein F7725_007961 [Dissostichus mawsoni]|uniref:C-type lectin domain-containing protein n=1 Tax=Dissostichus mawsoni TaxID=36200 RepID=A0A7J5Y8W7_DISMA|nr:hypothetical protein F7725_007961 [Dissostichus mawsoni]